jgi:hypothetical protein
MHHSAAAISTAPRSHIARWVALLALGYVAGSALLVRDFVVQTRTAAQAQSAHEAAVSSPSYTARLVHASPGDPAFVLAAP